MSNETVSRSWFAVLNNPEKNGYDGTPEEIIEKLKDEWIKDNPTRKGWWAYCISPSGTPHVHMILEDICSCRFSKIKKHYSKKAHLEPTKGSKSQVIAYIKKEPPYDEKGEKVITFTSYGNIEGHKQYQTKTQNETLYSIEAMIEEGMSPRQIMNEDIKFRREESLVRKCYFAKRYKETPPLREVKVVYHMGPSSSGKTFSYIDLCEKYGEDNIYFYSDYSNKGVGGFDNYMGEKYLFMDELKTASLPYEFLLTLLQGYRSQIHCRYANCYALWDEVHITSIYTPEEIYASTVDVKNRKKDKVDQLLRRIDTFIYHYKENGEYKKIEMNREEYLNMILNKSGKGGDTNERKI